MKIAITTKKYFPILGGSVVFAAMLAEAFVELGHEVKLMTRTPGPERSTESYEIIRRPGYAERRNLAQWADVLLQVDASWQDVWPFLLEGKPWFPTIHRGKPSYRSSGTKAAFLLALEELGYRCGNTVSVSEYSKISWNLPAHVIQNPYDGQKFHPGQPSGMLRDIDVLFVGRIAVDKGVFILLDVLKEIAEEAISPVLKKIAFVGAGVVEKELKEAARKGLGGLQVDFPGQLSSEEVGQWMRRSRVLAFPTTPDWFEASPLTPLEAAACGCWIVASDVGGTLENVPPEHWTVKAGSAASLKASLIAALSTPNNPSHAPTVEFLKTRSLKATAEEYLALFRNALKPL